MHLKKKKPFFGGRGLFIINFFGGVWTEGFIE